MNKYDRASFPRGFIFVLPVFSPVFIFVGESGLKSLRWVVEVHKFIKLCVRFWSIKYSETHRVLIFQVCNAGYV